MRTLAPWTTVESLLSTTAAVITALFIVAIFAGVFVASCGGDDNDISDLRKGSDYELCTALPMHELEAQYANVDFTLIRGIAIAQIKSSDGTFYLSLDGSNVLHCR